MTGVAVQKRNVSMVYQQFINHPHLTVYDNIASPRVAGLSDKEIAARRVRRPNCCASCRCWDANPAELSAASSSAPPSPGAGEGS